MVTTQTGSDNSNLIVAALRKTDPDLAMSIDAENSWKDGIMTRGARVAKYRRYERGNHDADLTTQMRKMLRLESGDGANLKEFNDNYMRIVVDKMASRLRVASITTDTDDGNTWIDELLEDNDWESLEGELYRGAIRDADSYILVDPITTRWVAQPAYDGFSGMTAIFNRKGEPVWACVLWSEADNEDLTGDESSSSVIMKVIVYQPNQISFWKGNEGTTDIKPVNQAVDKPVSGVEPTNSVVWKLGKIPLLHYVNQKDNYTPYGESELRPAMPLQDALNRTLHSMIMASEFSAFRLIWSIGMEVDVEKITPGAVLNLILGDGGTADLSKEQIEFLKAIRVGIFEGTDITQYTTQIEKLVKEISQATQTPIYGITAQGNVSGDALRQLEIGLIGKIKRFQRENTAAIKSLIFLTAEIQNTFTTEEGVNAPSFEMVAVEWQSPEILDVAAQITVLVTMRKDAPNLWPDRFYREQIGGLLGMAQSKISEEGDEIADEQSQRIAQLTGGVLGTVPVA